MNSKIKKFISGNYTGHYYSPGGNPARPWYSASRGQATEISKIPEIREQLPRLQDS